MKSKILEAVELVVKALIVVLESILWRVEEMQYRIYIGK